jgi:glutathione S-transferase
MTEIVVHGISFSPYVRAVRMALEIKGVAYRMQEVGPRSEAGGLGSPEHLGMHPFGRVPILDDGDFRLYETQAILRYLDARYPQAPLQPADARGLGRMSQAMGVFDCYMFTGAIRPIGGQRVVRPNLMGAASDETVVAGALPVAETCVKALDQVLGADRFLAGDALTMADLMVAPQMHLITPVPEFRAMLNGTRLGGWMERMLAHPAMIATSPPAALKLPVSLLEAA